MIEYCEFENLGEIITSHEFFVDRKSLFKIVIGQNFFNFQQIFKIFAAHFRTN